MISVTYRLFAILAISKKKTTLTLVSDATLILNIKILNHLEKILISVGWAMPTLQRVCQKENFEKRMRQNVVPLRIIYMSQTLFELV
jgi:hypothetical protein